MDQILHTYSSFYCKVGRDLCVCGGGGVGMVFDLGLCFDFRLYNNNV